MTLIIIYCVFWAGVVVGGLTTTVGAKVLGRIARRWAGK